MSILVACFNVAIIGYCIMTNSVQCFFGTMQNIGVKQIMDIDMFYCIHEGGELINGDNGAIKYIGG